jgi:superfamily II RNA helicase
MAGLVLDDFRAGYSFAFDPFQDQACAALESG